MFKPLDDISEPDLPLVGGKAFNCARLSQAGFPVPKGLAIPSGASDDEVRQLATEPWLDTLPIGTRFAVRSSGVDEDSAGHSFAGMHETQLNVERAQLVDAVLVCRQSADSRAARAYRATRRLADDEARIGVLVQRMVAAVSSGVAFTINPVTGADEIVVNAARGLGEALVSGQIEPDEFRISKRDASPISTHLAARAPGESAAPVLSPADVAVLGGLLTRIEQHYSAPQDVEWCHDGQQFWIVQSRPVTTKIPNAAAVAAPPARNLKPEINDLKSPDIEWTRANLAEVLPDQLSPQALQICQEALDRGERAFIGRLMAPESELGPIVKAFHGRLYFNLTQLRRIAEIVGKAPADTLRSLGHSEQIHPEDEIARRPQLRRLLPAVPDLIRLVVNVLRAPQLYKAHRVHVEQILERLSVDPKGLSDADIAAMFDWWLASIPETLKVVLVMSFVQMREDQLRQAARAVGFPYDRLVYPQLAAGERSVSTQQAVDLVGLAEVARHDAVASAYLLGNDGTFGDIRSALAATEFLRRFDRFLDQYGHRGHYESDWALPRLHEQPAPALFAIRALLQGPPQDTAAAARKQESEAIAAWREFEERATVWQRWTLLPRVRSTLRALKRQYLWREAVRSDLTRVVSRVRAWHLVLADRFVERGWIDHRDDYFLLDLADVKMAALDPASGPRLRALAAGRRVQLEAERGLVMPLLMRESELPALLRSGSAASTIDRSVAALTGLCVSPGAVEAEVVVLRAPGEFALMKRGAILVTTATDPSWTPLFTLASGVIVEVGGMLSHASTIAREYGLPALANVKDATRILKTGQRVRLDASAGRVVL